MTLAWNNPQGLICHSTNKQKLNKSFSIAITVMLQEPPKHENNVNLHLINLEKIVTF